MLDLAGILITVHCESGLARKTPDKLGVNITSPSDVYISLPTALQLTELN